MNGLLRIATTIDGCAIRPWHEDDRAALVRHGNSRAVWRNLTGMFPHPYTDADAAAWVSVAAVRGPDLHLAIELDGQAIGGIGVIAGTDVHRFTGRLGYWLGEAHWGTGIATASARAMVDHVFAHSSYQRIEATVYAWNQPSMRVLEKAGFVREGWLARSVFKDGEFIDAAIYARLRPQP